MKLTVTDFTLYARRYLIGYVLMSALIIGILSVAALFIPGELRAGEIDAALKSGALSMQSIEPSSVINLPYYLLQRLSFLLLGVTTLSIKLPSIVLATLTIIGIFALTRSWFRRNIAVLITIIAAASVQFLFLSQDATPNIMFSFVTIWLLAASTFVTRIQLFSTLWKVVACVLLATALYIPLGIYLVITLIITASLHPHIRYVIRRVSRLRLIIAVILGLISIAPLVYAIVLQPSVALVLLGIPTTGINLAESIPTAGLALFGFTASTDGFLLRPVYSLGLALLIAIGGFQLLSFRYTARNYAILILSALLIPLVFINPAHATALYPISVLLSALGINSLIGRWYKLFPRNPYARVAGLLPISLLVVGLAFTGVMRYANNYTYNPGILRHYSGDLALLSTTLQNKGDTVVVAGKDEIAFYALVAHYDKRFTASESHNVKASTVILTSKAYHEGAPAEPPAQIITNQRTNDADRFYIYKTTAK